MRPASNIKSITAHPLRYPEPHNFGKLRYITLARVETTDGAVGWGECISQFPDSCLATKTVIEEGYAPMLVGQNALEVEARWHQMLDRVWWYGPQGIAAFAISAVDMALWDVKGQVLDLPVCNLIGGKLREAVVAMASIHFDMDDLDGMASQFGLFRKKGYKIVKGGFGRDPQSAFGRNERRDLELAHCIRQVIGPDIDMVMDVCGARLDWDVHTAINRIRNLEPCRLLWIEEPLPPQDYQAHVFLRNHTSTRIGSGEQEWNLDGYRRLIEAGGVDVVQMDPGRCHGITGCLNAIKLVEAAKLKFSAHTWSSAINTAASVHLLATSNAGICMDFKPHESPMQHELVNEPWQQSEGLIAVPDKPGLGINVREEIVRKYEFN
jgi:L-alanine-DL-glutamate epimerase-like enolase superfamily enzyme